MVVTPYVALGLCRGRGQLTAHGRPSGQATRAGKHSSKISNSGLAKPGSEQLGLRPVGISVCVNRGWGHEAPMVIPTGPEF
jgi:hypothetical protein